jgi:hypothetical protein
VSEQKRRALLIGLLISMLAVAALWSWDAMASQRRLAEQAAADLGDCRRLAGDIAELRGKPAVARTEDVGVRALGDRIETSAAEAGLSGSWLEGVYPQSARREGDSPYMTKPTVLAVRAVTLGQLAAFLYHLTEDPALSVADLRLRSPHGETSRDQWDAEATVSYLIYSPSQQAGTD